MVSNGLIYGRVYARAKDANQERLQAALSKSGSLISHLQRRVLVNPHAEENPLYKLQNWSDSTGKNTYDDVPLPAARQTHHIFNIQATPCTFTVTRS